MTRVACETVRRLINKTNCPERPKKPGNPGYPWLVVIRVLVFAALKGLHTNKGLHRYLSKRRDEAMSLGLKTIPHRTTISRWRRRWFLLVPVFAALSRLIESIVRTRLLIMDSSPIPDRNDPDATKGKYSKGWFYGFKYHWSVNQLGLPIRFVFSVARPHDSNFASMLVVKAGWILGDSAYDSAWIRKLCRMVGSRGMIARNPRNTGKVFKKPKLLKRKRYINEKANSLLKTEIINEEWYRFKGFNKKCCFVLAGAIAVQIMGIDALLNGKKGMYRISEYRI